MIRRIATRLIRLNYRVESTRQRIHKIYKLIVPTRWRGVARWVWGVALVSGVLWWQAAEPAPLLAVYFYNVGQGDAIHVRTSEGFDVLIDGGPTGRVVEKLGRTLPFWDDIIELMILTHPHADHVTGQIEVLKRFQVEKVLASGVLHTTDEYLAWLQEIKKQGVPMEIPQAGMWVELGRSRGQSPFGTRSVTVGDNTMSSSSPRSSSARSESILDESTQAGLRVSSGGPPAETASPILEILWPQDSFEGKRVREGKIGEGGGLNDTSVVAKLTFGERSFLLMGDATSKVEEQLVHSLEFGVDSIDDTNNYELSSINSRLRTDVLKVGHHGSKYSTSREFLVAVQPKYAVIQVGENRYGHPAFAALHRLNQAGVEVLRNDQDGDIVFETDGLDIKRRP